MDNLNSYFALDTRAIAGKSWVREVGMMSRVQ